jgi:NAD(P)-dependent dehydrogenase (short-subunit alcohol dehydrogenase family)
MQTLTMQFAIVTAVGRLGQPEDLEWAVRLLASREAGYITGSGLPVDGGQTLPEARIPAHATDAILATAGA